MAEPGSSVDTPEEDLVTKMFITIGTGLVDKDGEDVGAKGRVVLLELNKPSPTSSVVELSFVYEKKIFRRFFNLSSGDAFKKVFLVNKKSFFSIKIRKYKLIKDTFPLHHFFDFLWFSRSHRWIVYRALWGYENIIFDSYRYPPPFFITITAFRNINTRLHRQDHILLKRPIIVSLRALF